MNSELRTKQVTKECSQQTNMCNIGSVIINLLQRRCVFLSKLSHRKT